MKLDNIEDVDLNNREMLEICMRNWHIIEELSETHIKVLDLLIDMKDRWRNSGLLPHHKKAIKSLVINDSTNTEATRDLNISLEELTFHVNEGLELLSESS